MVGSVVLSVGALVAAMQVIRSLPGLGCCPERSGPPVSPKRTNLRAFADYASTNRTAMSNFVALVVEDDPLQREVMADLLKDEGLEVVECGTAEAAELVLVSTGTELKALVTDIRSSGDMSGRTCGLRQAKISTHQRGDDFARVPPYVPDRYFVPHEAIPAENGCRRFSPDASRPLAQKQNAPAPEEPEPMRLEQGLLPCQLV